MGVIPGHECNRFFVPVDASTGLQSLQRRRLFLCTTRVGDMSHRSDHGSSPRQRQGRRLPPIVTCAHTRSFMLAGLRLCQSVLPSYLGGAAMSGLQGEGFGMGLASRCHHAPFPLLAKRRRKIAKETKFWELPLFFIH